MACNKANNLKNGWNRYCTGINKIPGIKNDTVFGVYLGCACREHDIQYSKEGVQLKIVADLLFSWRIIYLFVKKYRHIGGLLLGLFVSIIFFIFTTIVGLFIWKTWSSKWSARYQ